MIYYQTYAQRMMLQPGDVVIAPKSKFGIIDHYLVYRGIDTYGQEIYIENDYWNGVRQITGTYFAANNPLASVRRLSGNEAERYWACVRADSLLTAKYDLKRFNCESFANFVQYGIAFSTQVNIADGNFITWLVLGAATSVQRALR
jgi:hypothetical protein